MELAAKHNEVFTWLTATNKGASEVCMAALRNKGITEKDTDAGFPCDPTSKSKAGILAKPGIVLRLTRNMDKSRGFVNGALCIVVEQLDGNQYFVGKLIGSGNYVLVHPMHETDLGTFFALLLRVCHHHTPSTRTFPTYGMHLL